MLARGMLARLGGVFLRKALLEVSEVTFHTPSGLALGQARRILSRQACVPPRLGPGQTPDNEQQSLGRHFG